MAAPPPSSFDPASWGSAQWIITTIIGIFTAVSGYAMKTSNHLSRHSLQLGQHKEMIDEIKEDLSEKSTQEDVSGILQFIEIKFDQLNTRLERIDARIDSILRKP
jgi:hypothetical protein